MTIPGEGGQQPAPQNAPPPGQLGYGVQPGSTAIIVAHTVIVFGTGANTGFFVYKGTPTLGNPPILAITTASTDPYGNPVNPSAITDSGMPLLIYSAAAALGDLVASIAATAGPDAFGNTVDQGIVSYGGTGFARLLSGLVELTSGATDVKIQANGAGGSLDVVFGASSLISFALVGGLSGNPNQIALVAHAPGSSSGESWHNIAPVAGFSAGSPTPQYELEPINGGRVRLRGTINLTANQAINTVFFTLPAGYRPATAANLIGPSNLSGISGLSGWLNVSTGGAMSIAVAGSNTNTMIFDGMTFPLD